MAKLILGTRSSKLALWQSNYVKELIENRFPEIIVEVREVRTQGDILSETPLIQIGGKGLFTKEIELELIAGSIDIAVHSLKDLPVELPQGLILAGVPERHNAEDVFIAKNGKIKFSDLSPGATVATGSLRRKSQLLAYRNDFNIVGLRGNVNTRINKLFQSEWDGIILARAGVERLGLESYMTEILPFEIMLPAVGQGALGLEAVHT
ncbi:MAG: hydroxymethylbilane synthase, partial [Bacteroidota bacterium]|nr:hydroxymethylbilane synthase [Bacteroidota bacterium]